MQEQAVTGTTITHVKDFAAFVATIYGLAAGVGSVAVLAGLLNFMPVKAAKREKPPGLMRLPPGVFKTLSPFATVVVVLLLVLFRGNIERMTVAKTGLFFCVAIAIGLACILGYTSLYHRATLARPKPGQTPEDQQYSRWGYATRDFVLLIYYVGIFTAFSFSIAFLCYKLYLSQPEIKKPVSAATRLTLESGRATSIHGHQRHLTLRHT